MIDLDDWSICCSLMRRDVHGQFCPEIKHTELCMSFQLQGGKSSCRRVMFNTNPIQTNNSTVEPGGPADYVRNRPPPDQVKGEGTRNEDTHVRVPYDGVGAPHYAGFNKCLHTTHTTNGGGGGLPHLQVA
jgi:hypothetical protein